MTIRLTILLTFLSLFAVSQTAWQQEWLRQDKALHVSCSAVLSMSATELLQDVGLSRHEAEIAAIGFSLAVGVTKEFIHDSSPSAYDLAANITGAIGGIYLNRLLQSIPPPEVRKQRRIERKLKRFNLGTR